MQFGDGTTRAQLSVLPATLRPHLRRLRRSVYVYQMPASVNRAAEAWMWRQWGKDAGRGCDPVHNRRIYSAQSHFDAHLLHDDFTRTLDPKRASLFYVPLFLNQRVPWGADLNASMSRALAPSPFPQARDLPPEPSPERPAGALQYIRTRHPWWNASSGRDHVWFVFGERQTCLVPPEIAKASIIVGHWGDEDCMSPDKDVVVPTITPVQHDYPRFVQGRDGTHSLQRSMRGSAELPLGRCGPSARLLPKKGLEAGAAPRHRRRRVPAGRGRSSSSRAGSPHLARRRTTCARAALTRRRSRRSGSSA